MPVRINLAPFVVALALNVGSAAPGSAQPLPLLPSQITVQLQSSGAHHTTWKIGPVLLELPKSWVDASRPNVASLKEAEGAVATFVTLEATKAARDGGYSVLKDTARGPESFVKYVQWDDCEGTPNRVAKPLPVPPGSKAMLAECTVEGRPGSPSVYAQVTLYSANYVVQMHVIGSRKVVNAFLQRIQRIKWHET